MLAQFSLLCSKSLGLRPWCLVRPLDEVRLGTRGRTKYEKPRTKDEPLTVLFAALLASAEELPADSDERGREQEAVAKPSAATGAPKAARLMARLSTKVATAVKRPTACMPP